MYERLQLTQLLGLVPTYSSGLNGTFELIIDIPMAAEVCCRLKLLVTALQYSCGRPARLIAF